MASEELEKTLDEARLGILWKVVDHLNASSLDAEYLQALAMSYHLLSTTKTSPPASSRGTLRGLSR